MILIDNALEKLEKEGKPIRVGMIGAGFMASGIALQILKSSKGIRLSAIANRTLEKAKHAYEQAGVKDVSIAYSQFDLETAASTGKYVITEDPMLLCKSDFIDVIIEVTGTIEYASHIVMTAIAHKKHVILMNAEIDGTIGPILKKYADKEGVIITNADGDQPGVIMNLYRFVKGMGVKPVLCGNIKGLHDPYRNPTTQEPFAKKWGQQAHMVTSFADGSKVSFEQAIVANGTGMGVGKRGMYGPVMPTGTLIKESPNFFPQEALNTGSGIVDYVVGAEPNPGVFVIGTHNDPIQKHYLNLYKLGEGPYYCFYTPYHLCHFEVPNTIARVAIFKDATLTPLAGPMVRVVATAKTDLKKGDILDGIGHYMLYGLCENEFTARKENLLPIGLSEGCVLTRDIKKDAVLTFSDVVLPEGRLSDKLWNEQMQYFQ
jgi:predicted homoserine dehydrogenase-like protein